MARVFIAGDLVNTRNEAGVFCHPEVSEVVRSADYAVVNLEAPLRGQCPPPPKSGPRVHSLPSTIAQLRGQGFRAVGLANNHIMDFGPEGLAATIEKLDLHGIAHFGAGFSGEQSRAPLVVDILGTRIGFLGACEAQFGVLGPSADDHGAGYAWLFDPRVSMAVRDLRSECDRVIVCAHAGLEHESIPQPEWRAMYRMFCDLGADAVIGSHPHVPQGIEAYRDSVIVYSLGNFYFDALSFRDRPDHSFSVMLTLPKRGSIGVESIQHRKSGTAVVLTPSEEWIDLAELNDLLGSGYGGRADEMALRAHARLRPLLSTCFRSGPPLDEPIFLAKRLANRLLGRERRLDRALTAMHVIRNESYRFALERALKRLSRQ